MLKSLYDGFAFFHLPDFTNNFIHIREKLSWSSEKKTNKY